jgi:hypothetical protein
MQTDEVCHFDDWLILELFKGMSITTKFHLQFKNLNKNKGRDVTQSVSRWLPTAAARVRVRAACGVCSGQSGTGAGFLRVFRFPLPIIPPISPSS